MSSMARVFPCALLLTVLAQTSGCANPRKGPIAFYLDGAGWYGSAASVEAGLRQAGYRGAFDTFTWSSFLGPAHDHFVAAHDRGNARRLARNIEQVRKNDASGPIHLMGLSAGTAVILSALEELEGGVQVDNVVLFSPTVSAERDLTKIMQHVRQRLYATCSPHDAIVASLAMNADGKPGPPTGTRGFRIPRKASETTREAYARVVNVPWRPSYAGYDWDGSHTSVTSTAFVASVIAPRILSNEPYPLDQSLAERGAAALAR